MALSMRRQTQGERIRGWVMFILDCILISAVNRLLLLSAFPDENHMLNKGWTLRSPAPQTQRSQASSSSNLKRFVGWSSNPRKLWKSIVSQEQFIFLSASGPVLIEHSLWGMFGILIWKANPLWVYLTAINNILHLMSLVTTLKLCKVEGFIKMLSQYIPLVSLTPREKGQDLGF